MSAVDAAIPSVQGARKRFARNVMSLASVQFANMLVPLITVPYLVRIIGPANLGLVSFSQAYITYFILLINYGFDLSAVRAIAARRDDGANTDRVFQEVMAGKTLLWIFATVIFSAITFTVPEFRAHLGLHICTYLSCVGVVLFPTWLYQAQEELGRIAIFNLAVRIGFSLAVFVLVRRPEDYVYQVLSLSVAQVLAGLAALVFALRRFKVTLAWPGWHRMVGRFRSDLVLFLSSVMITMYASSGAFILGLLSSSYSVGIFAAGIRLESLARAFVSLALNQAFFPVVANAFGRSRADGLALVRKVFAPLLVGLTVISLALWVMAPIFIHLFYGRPFEAAIGVLRIVSVLTLTIGVSNLLGFHVMLNLQMDRIFFAVTTLGSVVGVVLTFVLVSSHGEFGAAWAWVLTEILITLLMYVCVRRQGVALFGDGHFRTSLAYTGRLLRETLHFR